MKQQLENGSAQTQASVGTAAPVGDQAGRIILGSGHRGGLRPESYLITATVTTAGDLLLYGRVDSVWGLLSSRQGAHPQGKIGNALSVGVHHIVVEDIGMLDELFFTTSVGGAISSVTVKPIIFSM